MIITCPECEARFVVPSTIFMRGGRKMKCASCNHVWFQDEPLEKSESLNEFQEAMAKSAGETIPDKPSAPLKEGSNDPTDKPWSIRNDFKTGKKWIGIGFILPIIFYILYLVLQAPLIMGQGLAFDKVAIDRKADSIDVTGEIINTIDEKRGVPNIKITQILNNDVIGDSVIITPDRDVLQSGAIMAFTTTIKGYSPDIKRITVNFDQD